jgi:hypothetical protein
MDGFWGGWAPLGTLSCMTTTPGPEGDTPERQKKAVGWKFKLYFGLPVIRVGKPVSKSTQLVSGSLKLCPVWSWR